MNDTHSPLAKLVAVTASASKCPASRYWRMRAKFTRHSSRCLSGALSNSDLGGGRSQPPDSRASRTCAPERNTLAASVRNTCETRKWRQTRSSAAAPWRNRGA